MNIVVLIVVSLKENNSLFVNQRALNLNLIFRRCTRLIALFNNVLRMFGKTLRAVKEQQRHADIQTRHANPIFRKTMKVHFVS